MSDENHSRNTPKVALEALAHELRGRCEAASRFSGGHTYHAEEVGIFRQFAEENDLFLETIPVTPERPCDDEGNEHQVWFIDERDSYLKATWPNFFGKLVVFRQDESSDASPIQYLERWSLHNEIFGDDVTFLGVVDTLDGMRLIIEQPAIAGVPADERQIRDFFEKTGWKPFQLHGNLAFYDPETQIVVSDTHPGNLILMADGLFAPIDLRVQRLTEAEELAVRQMIG